MYSMKNQNNILQATKSWKNINTHYLEVLKDPWYAIQGNGKIIGKKNSLNIVIDNFSIKEETNFGAHYLNAIIVIGYEVSFIRRLIYTKPEGE